MKKKILYFFLSCSFIINSWFILAQDSSAAKTVVKKHQKLLGVEFFGSAGNYLGYHAGVAAIFKKSRINGGVLDAHILNSSDQFSPSQGLYLNWDFYPYYIRKPVQLFFSVFANYLKYKDDLSYTYSDGLAKTHEIHETTVYKFSTLYAGPGITKSISRNINFKILLCSRVLSFGKYAMIRTDKTTGNTFIIRDNFFNNAFLNDGRSFLFLRLGVNYYFLLKKETTL